MEEFGPLRQRYETDRGNQWFVVGLGGFMLVFGGLLLLELPDRVGGSIACGAAALMAMICFYGAYTQRGIRLDLHELGLVFEGPSKARVVLPYEDIAELALITFGWHNGFRIKQRNGKSLRLLGFASSPSAYRFVVDKLR